MLDRSVPIRIVILCALWSALAARALAPRDAGAQTEFQMEIRTGSLVRIPIHVEEFLYETGISPIRFANDESPEQILVRDLDYSSFFRVSRGPAAGAAGADPGGQASRPPEGTRTVASGMVRRSWGRLVLTGSLRDAATSNRIFEKDYALGEPPDRWAVHAFADDIVLYMTGERGVAQTRIAFVRDYGGGKRELHLVDADGLSEQQLTHLGTLVLSPAWSPTGDRLAFTSFGFGQPAVVGFALRDQKSWRISPAGASMAASPAFSPDGRRVAYTQSIGGNLEIFASDADGGHPLQLTFNPAIDTSPTFSPDGGQIAFTSDRSGNPQIYVMDREGGNVRRLTFAGKQSDSPDWSPKGDRIAFVCIIDDVFDICTMRPDGSDPARLTAGEGMHENPRWAPDGRHLVYSKLSGGERRIYVMAADGSGKRALTGGRGAQYNPAWSPALSLQSVRGQNAD